MDKLFLCYLCAEKSNDKMFKSKIFYHLIALLTIIIWSNTFVSSKILLHNGLSPAEIFAIRFALAYVAIIPFTHSKLWCDNLKDELLMLVLGATGGALYFLAENTALKYTGVSNVCLLVCSAPLLTALLARWFGKSEKMSSRLITGSLIAFAGAALVIVEDWKHMQLKLLGDMLALCGALSWAVYQLIIKRMCGKYSTVFITRKVFAYGLLTIAAFFVFDHPSFPLDSMLHPVVAGNLLFLGIIASGLCFWVWNIVIDHLGAVATSAYIYLQPLFAAITASFVLGEPITGAVVAGAVLIIAGVYWAEH